MFFQGCRDDRDLHSFPTRRSSDLRRGGDRRGRGRGALRPARDEGALCRTAAARGGWGALGQRRSGLDVRRSEEHTSELQSRLHLVCRLLLEKKKKLVSVYPARTRK